jgi:hypothetical protein
MSLVKRRSKKARLFISGYLLEPIRGAVVVLMLGVLLMGIPGCMENIALIGRPTIEEGRNDVVGEVERVDLSSRRIYLRPNSGDRRVVAFATDAQVLDRGREYPMERLKPGDTVAMQMKRDSRGDSYADLIRIQAIVGSRNASDVVSSGPRIQTLAGQVQSVNRRDNLFALDHRPGQVVLVLLSQYVRESDKDRFRTLRAGDYVRLEGKFTERDRFELLSFLNDDS